MRRPFNCGSLSVTDAKKSDKGADSGRSINDKCRVGGTFQRVPLTVAHGGKSARGYSERLAMRPTTDGAMLVTSPFWGGYCLRSLLPLVLLYVTRRLVAVVVGIVGTVGILSFGCPRFP